MVKVREITIDSKAVGSVLQSCRALFDSLDRDDPFQADLSRKAWEFRAHVLFTLLPFDSHEIELLARLEEIADAAKRIPGAVNATGSLEQAARFLLNHPDNPKYHWIMAALDTALESAPPERMGLLSMMAMGKTFGCPKTTDGLLDAPRAVQVIESRRSLASEIFDRVIIPGTCHYLSSALHLELFHEGRVREVDVLVYPGEWFSLRNRLVPPGSAIFLGRLTSSRIACTAVATSDMPDATEVERDEADADTSMRDELWQITHDGEKSPAPGLVSSRYVLCRNGHGLFVPIDAHFMVWRDDASDEDSQMESVPVDRLAEGDWLVMQPTDTGYLLDLESAEAGFGQRMEDACDWRPALERLLLTSSPVEIAEEMLAEGAHGVSLVQSVRNWTDGSVYGPGDRNELRVLLALLIRHGKLPVPENFDQYVAEHWKGLQEIRGIRHRAGLHVRSEIHRQLSSALGQLGQLGQLGVCQDVMLDGGVRIQLSQVAALDEQISWVPSSRLMHLQPMKGGRWRE